jgi:hypothetical protein
MLPVYESHWYYHSTLRILGDKIQRRNNTSILSRKAMLKHAHQYQVSNKIVIVFVIISSYKNKCPSFFFRVTSNHSSLAATHVERVLDLVHDTLLLLAVLALAGGRDGRRVAASVGGGVVASSLCGNG